MRTLLLLVCHLATLQALRANSTIDRLIVGDLSLYPAQNPSSYTPSRFMYPESEKGHYTSDGAFWERGAGIGQIIYATYQGVTASDGFLYYHFAAPTNGILISYTDYGFGGNFSTQGTLGYSGDLVFVAQQGSTLARCTGATTILDNSPTGSDSFHYYSASEGQSVFFQLDVTIRDTTWQPNSFLGNFNYNGTGFVDFTQVVPEPGTIALFGIGGGFLILRRRAISRSLRFMFVGWCVMVGCSGLVRAQTWSPEVGPAGTVSGVVTTGGVTYVEYSYAVAGCERVDSIGPAIRSGTNFSVDFTYEKESGVVCPQFVLLCSTNVVLGVLGPGTYKLITTSWTLPVGTNTFTIRPVLQSVGFDTNGCFRLQMSSGVTNVSYVVQYSTNLVDWISFSTNSLLTNAVGVPLIDDSPALLPGCRYYRVLCR